LSQCENQPEQAIEHCRLALEKDPDFWPAALQCADLNFDSENWELAYGYYCRAFATTTAKTFPEFNFRAAWSAGKIGKDSEAENYYHACLDLHPEYLHARNNLGWSIYRQGRFEEALAVFDKCIARNESGDYPKRNRAKTLARLGRLREAMEAWKQTGRGGRLSKLAREKIAKLQARLNTGEGGTVGAQEDKEDGDVVGYQGEGKKRRKRNY
jgi:Tfp pilus assembly protein PilF